MRSEAFLSLWNATPATGRERSSKKQAWGVWRRMKLEPIAAEISDGLARWKSSAKWTRDGGEYVEGLHRWLMNRQWEEAPPASKESPPITSSNPNSVSAKLDAQRRAAAQVCGQ